MDGIALLKRLHQHQYWVARQLLAAAKGLGQKQLLRRFEIGPGSVWETLRHLYQSESIWLATIGGDPNPPPPPVPSSIDELAAAWDRLETRWEKFYANLKQADLAKPVAKVSSRSPGKPLVTPLADVLLHLGTHSYYHTAQVVNMLRHLGVKPLPETMLISMSRAELAAAQPS